MLHPSAEERGLLRRCARVLEQERHSIAAGLIDNACIIPRWKDQRAAHSGRLDDFIALEGHAFVDYLATWLRSGNDIFKDLYVGLKLKQLYEERETSGEEQQELRTALLAADAACLYTFLSGRVSPRALELFAAAVDELHTILLNRGVKVLDILFVGDCLHVDVMGFLASRSLGAGITIRPCFATSKDHVALGNHLRDLGGRRFDVVFYSPFTYEFDVHLTQVHRPKAALLPGRRVDDIVDIATGIAESQISLLSDLFDCPIHIHNTASIVRDLEGSKGWSERVKWRVKTMMTMSVRRRTVRRIDHWIRALIEEKNEKSFKHLFLVDEIALARPFGEAELGACTYSSRLQHPCRFSEVVAARYVDLIAVHAHLAGKKLVVCDLDNTLWNGVIGEGEVTHFHDRQARLLDLKSRGIVLSINSKNDPRNVAFNDGTLQASDFAYADIDWEPKVNGLRRTQEALNLHSRDFVFIDDRADERQMAGIAFPDMVVLDPGEEATWRQIALWHELLDPELAHDRTALYKEREARRASLQSQEQDHASGESLFQSLGIQVHLRRADPSDFKRVHELINRTNQFNLCGTRCTFSEVERWARSETDLVLIADARDRFGRMGTVGVIIVSPTTDHWDIPVFVLSCRVFGYGIERAMLNQVKLWTQDAAAPQRISGAYRDTGRNQPCSSVYAENGFVERGGRWVFEGGGPLPDAEWLSVVELSS